MKTDSTATPISKTRTNNLEVAGFSPRRNARAKARALQASAVIVVTVLCAAWAAVTVVAQAPRPILILVSLDGWRHDYLDRAKTPRLNALAAAGVRSEGLIPSFPSKTFPNHYTIVTGLYPEHHGIVSNNMLDATIGERFSMSAPTARDSRWWGGEPLWVTAQKQGQIAASMFWPGSEVEIGGVRPAHWKPFDDNFPNRQRVQQVLDWLALPERERPSFITLYFSDVDTAGHSFGPDSVEVLETAASLDEEIGALVDGVNAMGALADRVHYVIVSDHGMSQNSPERVIVLDDYIDMRTVDMIDTSPVAGFWPRSGTAEDIYLALKDKHPSFAVYRRSEVPAHLHYSTHPRIPPVIGIAADGWSVGSKTITDQWESGARRLGGNHGYDPTLRSMRGLFIATGAQFRKGVRVPPVENINLYSMMARVLGLKPAPNDGQTRATAGVFVRN